MTEHRSIHPDRKTLIWDQKRALTRRGVLWLGLKCDVRCKFCYDLNLEPGKKVWLGFNEITTTLDKYRFFYDNRFVDFMGGEPTLHPEILRIVNYSASIALAPTCITHGLHLADRGRVREFKAAGIHDFLVSVHGLGEIADRIHQTSNGSFGKQRRALENLREERVPFRFNTVMVRDNIHQLPDIALFCKEMGGTVINFLTFNPYFEWQADQEISFQARHTEILPALRRAIDICRENGIEANVRYMPICLLRGYEEHAYTGFQLPYDPHEWDYNSWYDRGVAGQPDRDWYKQASSDQKQRHNYVTGPRCQQCALSTICDGFHSQYLARWGDAEANPYDGPRESEPTQFISHQWKLRYLDSEHSDSKPASAAPLPSTQFSAEYENRAGIRR